MTHLQRFVSLLACFIAAIALFSCNSDEPFGPSQAASSVEKIAYVDAGRVFVDTGIGNPIALTEREYRSPKWSPDGSRLAMIKIDDYIVRISVVDDDGSNERIVYSAALFHSLYGITWSPDGAQIAFTDSYRGDATEDGQFGVSSLVLVDVDSGAARILGDDLYLLCWPSGSQSIFYTTNGILFPPYPGTSLHRLDPDSGETVDISELPFGTHTVSVSPDGQVFAYAAPASDVYHIYTEDVSTGRKSLVRETTSSNGGITILWSPDNRSIAVAGGDGDIYTARADGSRLTQLTTSGERYVLHSWSPNGDFLAYSNVKVGTLRIFSLREAAAGPQMTLTNDLDILWPNN